MEPRSLFNLILKIIGVFFIKDILESLSRSLSVLVYLPRYASENEAYFNLGVTVPPLVLYSIFAWLLIFRTNSIINILQLDKNVGMLNTEMRISRPVILSTAVIIIGGWLLVNEIPEFFRQITYYYQERRLYRRMIRPDLSYPVMSIVKIIIGLLMIVFNGAFVRILQRFWAKKETPHAG